MVSDDENIYIKGSFLVDGLHISEIYSIFFVTHSQSFFFPFFKSLATIAISGLNVVNVDF